MITYIENKFLYVVRKSHTTKIDPSGVKLGNFILIDKVLNLYTNRILLNIIL